MTATSSPRARTPNCSPPARSTAKSMPPKWTAGIWTTDKRTTEPQAMSQTNPSSRQDKPAPASPIGRGPALTGTWPHGRGRAPRTCAARFSASGPHLRRQKWALITVVFTTVATTATQLAGPYLLGVAIDNYILPGDLPGLLRIALLMLVIYWLHAFAHLVRDVCHGRRGPAHVARPAQRPLHQVADPLAALLDAHAHGDLMSRLTNDMETINTVLTDSVTWLISFIPRCWSASPQSCSGSTPIWLRSA